MHWMHLLHWLPLVLIPKTLAEYVVPSTWSGTNITASSEQRQSTVTAAIQEEFTNGTLTDNFYSALAVYDFYSNTTSYKNQVTAYFATATFQPNGDNNVCITFRLYILTNRSSVLLNRLGCIYAIRAYRTYGDSAMLDLAIQVWEFCRSYTISPTDVSTGSIATKSFNIAQSCSGVTLAGGMFWVTDVNDTTLYGVNTAAFFTLSAYLSQATSNDTYLSAAKDSGAFMIDIMDVAGEGNGLVTISANDSSTCVNLWGPETFLIDQAGSFMEGLAVLPGDTTFGQQNVSVDSLRSNLVNVTLATNPLCNAPNGIINVGGGAGDSSLVQGLGALYHVIQEPIDLVMYIGSFLAVQYNTITTAATETGSNIYANSWIGPPTSYNPSAQTLAIFGLVNGVQVGVATSSNGTSGSGSSGSGNSGAPGSGTGSGSSGNKQHTSLAGPIAGGVVGGVVLLAAIWFLIFFINRRRRRANKLQTSPNLFVDTFEVPQSHSISTFSPSKTVPQSNVAWSPTYPQVANWDSTGEYSQSTDTPSIIATDSSALLEQVPTHNLLQILQSRLQQEGSRSEQESAPPAYEATD